MRTNDTDRQLTPAKPKGNGKKIIRVPANYVLAFLAPHKGTPPAMIMDPNPIPSGACVLAVHENHESRTFDFTLQAEEFEWTEPGTMLPVVHPAWRVKK